MVSLTDFNQIKERPYLAACILKNQITDLLIFKFLDYNLFTFSIKRANPYLLISYKNVDIQLEIFCDLYDKYVSQYITRLYDSRKRIYIYKDGYDSISCKNLDLLFDRIMDWLNEYNEYNEYKELPPPYDEAVLSPEINSKTSTNNDPSPSYSI